MKYIKNIEYEIFSLFHNDAICGPKKWGCYYLIDVKLVMKGYDAR